ncbi:MAG: hypothetical protein ACK4KV_09435 [Rhodocyclaceae bacterium]
MPRKPITIEGAASPRQRAWAAIRTRGVSACWTLDDIQADTRRARALGGSVEPATLLTYVQSLVAAGLVRVVSSEKVRGNCARKTYALVRDEGAEAPRVRRDGTRVIQGLAQEQMWRTLRMLGHGDTNARELAAHASSTSTTVAETAANDYLRRLAQAGYLDTTRPGHGTGRGGVLARYRLRPEMNTGPRPPMVCRTRVVFDPNLQAVVWAPVVTEEDAEHVR